MDTSELSAAIKALNIKPIDPYRASLYLDYLQATKDYLHTTLNAALPTGISTDAYAYCKSALRSSNLLQELANILDALVAPAVGRDLKLAFASNDWDYFQYFQNRILGASYNANVTAFRARFPISADGLRLATQNFQTNLHSACQRIFADRAMLQSLFEDQFDDDFTLSALVNIKSTGSDFHKGGKQVLILTFSASDEHPFSPVKPPAERHFNHKVVYKPSDVEADCLLAGNSSAVNRALNTQFMANSLFEIYNARCAAYKTAHPTFPGLPVNTYRILPRDYLSAHPGVPAPIRDAYGYLEYLDNNVSGTAIHFWGFYPFASSDFLIFPKENKTQIVADFYKQVGAMSAIAASFSMIDLHLENLRVVKRKPFFIDMEVALTDPVKTITDTSLMGPVGGVNGVSHSGQDYVNRVKNAKVKKGSQIVAIYDAVFYQNRLWEVVEDDTHGARRKLIPVDRVNYLAGFDQGMTILREAQQAGDFAAWIARLHNVVVRVLPFSTKTFRLLYSDIFIDGPGHLANYGHTLAQRVTEVLRIHLTKEYNNYVDKHDNTAVPDFVVFNQNDAGNDYLTLDIPIFYHRFGSTEILNSSGQAVAIPAQITILDGTGGTQQVNVTGPHGVLNRGTYYAAAPFPNDVQANQITPLGGAGFAARKQQIRVTIENSFSPSAPNAAGIFKPLAGDGGGS
ncbi:MAG: DUF4135 domain-containing protein [Pseudomonadota bacterium]